MVSVTKKLLFKLVSFFLLLLYLFARPEREGKKGRKREREREERDRVRYVNIYVVKCLLILTVGGNMYVFSLHLLPESIFHFILS